MQLYEFYCALALFICYYFLAYRIHILALYHMPLMVIITHHLLIMYYNMYSHGLLYALKGMHKPQ